MVVMTDESFFVWEPLGGIDGPGTLKLYTSDYCIAVEPRVATM